MSMNKVSKFIKTHTIRIGMMCAALIMLVIIAIFGMYFVTEKVEATGNATLEGSRVKYVLAVFTEGKYTLKHANVDVILYDKSGEEIMRVEEFVRGDASVSKSVQLPDHFDITQFDQAKFTIKSYALNNIYEIIVMCLCGAVLVTMVMLSGVSLVKKKSEDETVTEPKT